jgi:ABC-type glutathione transport system ATPase component
MSAAARLLEVEDLSVGFPVRGGVLRAVDSVSFHVGRGETLGLVGESGSGKSTIALAVMQVHRPEHGAVRFDGEDAVRAMRGDLKRLRRRMQIVFQNPYASLDPRLTVRRILAEPLEAHGIGTPTERDAKAIALLEQVGLDAAAADRYPAQFSGGQRQRI